MMDAATPDVDVRSHIAALPFWRTPVSIEPLVGGLCNKNFIAEASSQKYVVRVGRDIPVHGISQALVQNAMRAAAEVGVSPALRFASGPVTVSDFIDGRHLRPDDMQDDAILAGLVRRIRELHAGGAAIDGLLPYFWPFQVVRIYARYLKENKSRIVADVDALANHANALERLVSPFHPVFTHNDLVPQNVMIDKAGTLFLIDWDYGAYGHPLFDVAAITANIDDDSEAIDAKILTHYFGGLNDEIWKQFRIFKLVVNLRETLWGAVQELASKLDREIVEAGMSSLYPDQEQGYAGYTEMNRKRFLRNLEHFKRQHG
ncbi:choline/ethanolamine kinase family protein [Hyphomicrobium sp. DMF-1]|jgi:thiamine kinase-like enzyme|uniref:choline/ethanolamine kinase family protein n=1 Tax=Hyphomicrobium sp. DMF-1 TaxID=3019544 RepID=UPI0022EC1482|nr:choline/ethanolamine kinase family protein [Hyphomicrobium sp. DMF-1]WBT36765.1 phosphotransferase family protein [Hyphomicrobium sp. DMF-1]